MKSVQRMKQRSDWRPFFLYLGLVLLGILSLYPFQVAALKNLASEGALDLPLSAEWLGLIGLLQTFLLAGVALLAGHFLAGKVGLKSLLYARFHQAESLTGRGQGRAFLLAGGLGLGMGILFAGFDLWARQWLPFLSDIQPSFASLAMGILYGGIVEEVLMRWGLMTLLVYLFTRKGTRRNPAAYVAAILLVALLFALGHYNATTTLTEMTPLVWFRMLFLNGAGGVMFGWLYWKYHLESAIFAHMSTHVGMFLANTLLLLLGIL